MHQILFGFFQRGITPEREISRTRKKRVSNIFPRGIHTCIWNFKTLTYTVLELTDAQTDNPKPICSCNFFEVGGITSPYLDVFVSLLCRIDAKFFFLLVSNTKVRKFISFQDISWLMKNTKDQMYSELDVGMWFTAKISDVWAQTTINEDSIKLNHQ